MTSHQIASNGITGMAGSVLSVIATWQEQLEWWIRLSAGTVGLLIALVTLYRLLTQSKSRHDER
jgi:hypothetical protein